MDHAQRIPVMDSTHATAVLAHPRHHHPRDVLRAAALIFPKSRPCLEKYLLAEAAFFPYGPQMVRYLDRGFIGLAQFESDLAYANPFPFDWASKQVDRGLRWLRERR
jgi:hypothetical protein